VHASICFHFYFRLGLSVRYFYVSNAREIRARLVGPIPEGEGDRGSCNWRLGLYSASSRNKSVPTLWLVASAWRWPSWPNLVDELDAHFPKCSDPRTLAAFSEWRIFRGRDFSRQALFTHCVFCRRSDFAQQGRRAPATHGQRSLLQRGEKEAGWR